MAFHCSRACGVSFKGELYTILRVDKALAVVVQGCVSHGSQVDKEAKLVTRKMLGQVHVGSVVGATALLAFHSKEPACLTPHVYACDPLIVNPVWGSVDSDTYFGNVWIKVVFTISSTCSVGHNEQQK